MAEARGRDVTTPAPDAHGAAGRVRVFGAVLASDRSLPGLPVAPTRGDGRFAFWTLSTEQGSAVAVSHSDGARVTGRLDYSNGVTVTLALDGNRAEIAISDTGRFDLSPDGHQIVHRAPAVVDRGAVSLDIIGVVLPYALHRDGAWCVHASAVQTPSGVIAFVGQRGTGKSTLAAACVQAGCALVADDVVVLRDTTRGITVTPAGVPLRMRAKTAQAVGARSDGVDAWGKVRVDGAVAQETLPLAAIYLLQPMTANATVERAPRAMRAAALALLTNGKITALLGGDAGGEALARCVALAHGAEVFDLAIPRDLARLHDVTAQLLAWHAGVSTSAEGAS